MISSEAADRAIRETGQAIAVLRPLGEALVLAALDPPPCPDPVPSSPSDRALCFYEVEEHLHTLGISALLGVLKTTCEPEIEPLVKPSQAGPLTPRSDFWQSPQSYDAILSRVRAYAARQSEELRKKDRDPASVRVEAQFLRECEERILRHTTASLGRATRGGVPEVLWPVVAQAAWGAPTFQLSVATRVHALLQERYLFQRGKVPAPVLAVRTYWALLALTWRKPAPIPGTAHLFVDWLLDVAPFPFRLRRRAVAYLQAQARKETLDEEGWAGFWDQFVLMEALLKWHGDLDSVSDSIREPLAALPLLQECGALRELGRESRRTTVGTPPPSLASSDWDTERPPWLAAQYEPVARKQD